ncbi:MULTISPECIES: glutamate synthase-related protein [unclassified Clostridioides]|uniref:glutamate synthase-related protein n=1 Tax=unclassified Clostridioides TaxID=2635829 RepID=UPI001D0C45C8|nr:rubredoxin [Clostridioides sp. ES-S-0001-02]MCC0640710.1 rubredoxin [Clostridioides sp. ES-S-0049-03]MCC0653251.1 rubredoxin [Clostridioides sp. ES-S-0001-03]MCC0676120.1 rubredoxin [Clostridioides sp. ES-W-0018-02]MCC0681451.1 rubredoxin [Clostridioides sp. ES-S-0005-03]MCC0704076.1 rubredoxin [Clostridioides sp. ES-S-0049-02]MCC0710801.1 rubredoxin [Clostridioides sp. ES-W-0017-02]MCC0762288.1 rubredoxin [Clostridioides sp. ES-S-0006-03]UDN48326.1 rubredoxin [Clostridioides sp. ES-S-01
MSIYKCSVCGYIYDESKNDKTWDELSEDWTCPVCTKGRSYFGKISTVYFEGEEKKENKIEASVQEKSDVSSEKTGDLNYLNTYLRRDDEVEQHMDIIHEMAVTGKSIIEPMKTKLPVISWDDILIMGAQLNPLPLNEHDEVNTTTIIGKKAKKPMVIENPVYISHMSFGALSKELKIALAKGAAKNKTAMCSGEGGILPEEKEASYKYIFEYVPNKYSVTEENLKNSDAIEIKIGQGTKPGMGGHLPGEKVTEEIAKVRNKPVGQDVISPSCFEEIQSKEDLKKLVDELREVSEGRPIGIKISAGHIERDMEFIAYAKPDFMTIDGRGGATGASPKLLKDATSVPTIFALYRARKYIDTHGLDIDLVITGGLRISTDFAKAIAMGADAIAIASSALMAAACQQYRICGSGKCPVGVATQDEELRKRLHIENSANRVANFLNVSLEELKTFARISGHKDIHDLSVDDLYTVNSEISNYTNIQHV